MAIGQYLLMKSLPRVRKVPYVENLVTWIMKYIHVSMAGFFHPQVKVPGEEGWPFYPQGPRLCVLWSLSDAVGWEKGAVLFSIPHTQQQYLIALTPSTMTSPPSPRNQMSRCGWSVNEQRVLATVSRKYWLFISNLSASLPPPSLPLILRLASCSSMWYIDMCEGAACLSPLGKKDLDTWQKD